MTILVTGASGHLGRLVIDALLSRGATASDIVAGARTLSAIDDLAARGVRTVHLDYNDPATIAAALDGVDTVLLVSGSEAGRRYAGHKNVIDAAVAAGVAKFVYTSVSKATSFDWPLGAEHKATEHALSASGLPTVILRNDWYTENYVGDVQRAAESGVIAASVADGRVAPAARADYAEAAAVVLLEDGHIGEVYELAGDASLGYADLAAAAAEALGREVAYVPVSRDDFVAALQGSGLDAGTAEFVASMEDGIRGGVLADTDGTLSRLIGRPTTPVVDTFRAALAG
ncbi:NAD-dependent epimerase/dehydratase family protein [Microbacterium laevaniformans]|uniref:NAD-dependent epimerase/dehydratase family protein n=1 Tax=Microbacterium laevaniformans TaxID=36807 RepID=A0A4S2D5G0_9MICO|nr:MULTISPECIES: NmrA family NAD(P)-binding protein [Microbacterium]AXA95040.1 NAD(P)-dependent oxidoreductase [Microbacterium sp. PM5]TGY36809.1 NAD-dependent epimerase/dehydratase family protein [Microbacterium laevaniformans]